MYKSTNILLASYKEDNTFKALSKLQKKLLGSGDANKIFVDLYNHIKDIPEAERTANEAKVVKAIESLIPATGVKSAAPQEKAADITEQYTTKETANTTENIEKKPTSDEKKTKEVKADALKDIGVEIKEDVTSEGFYQVYKDGKFVGLLSATSFVQARNKGQYFDKELMSDILTRMGIEHSEDIF